MFKRAILESGSVYNNKDTPNLPKSTALSQAKSAAKYFNCSDSKWLDCLRKVDAKELTQVDGIGTWAVYETQFLPIMAIKAFQQHNYSTGIRHNLKTTQIFNLQIHRYRHNGRCDG